MELTVRIEAPELIRAINSLLARLDAQPATANAVAVKLEAVKPAAKSDTPAITLETVRSKLAALSQSGKQKEVKALISAFGVQKLTDIPAERYAEVLQKAGELE